MTPNDLFFPVSVFVWFVFAVAIYFLLSSRKEKTKIKITSAPQEKVHYRNPATIKVGISTRDYYSIKWMKLKEGREEVIDFSRNKYQESTCSINGDEAVLHISQVSAEDEGNYQLEVKFSDGILKSEHVKIRITGEKPEIMIVPNEVRVNYGESVKFTAKIRSSPPPHSVFWKQVRNGRVMKRIPNIANFFGEKSDELIAKLSLDTVSKNAAGEYHIEAQNVYGSTESKCLELFVLGEKPVLTVVGNVVDEVRFDSCVSISVRIQATPVPRKIIWKKYDTVKNIFVRLELSQKKYTGSDTQSKDCTKLCIPHVTLEDSGIYQVEASNAYGCGKSNEFLIKVLGEKPNVKESPKSLTIAHGNTAEFTAKINVTPRPLTVEWTHKSPSGFKKPVSMQKDKYKGSASTGDFLKLVINKVEFQDEGYYILRVKNVLGECTGTEAYLRVKGDPLVYNSGPTIVMQQKDIHCKAFASVPTNTQLKWQKIRGDTITDVDLTEDKYKESSTNLPNPTLVITNAEECDKADYRLAIQLANEEFSNRITVHVLESGAVITERKNNCFRMYRLQSVCKEAVQSVFNRYVTDLPTFLKDEKRQKLFREKLNHEQLSLLYPLQGKVATSSDFDISLLCSLMRHTKLIQPTAKDENWSKIPDPTSITEADDIIRIKRYRNFLSHASKFEIDTLDFNDNWLELSKAINRLQGAANLMPEVWKIQNTVITDSAEILEIEDEIKLLRKKIKAEELQDTCLSDKNFITTMDVEIKATDAENPEKNSLVKLLIESLHQTLSEIFDSVDDNLRIQTIKCQLQEQSSCKWDDNQRKNLQESFEFARDIAKRIDWSLSDIGVLIQFIRFAILFKSDKHFPDVSISWIRNELSFAIHFAKSNDLKTFIEKYSNKHLVQEIASLILRDEYLCKFYLQPRDIQISGTNKKRNKEQCKVKHFYVRKDEEQCDRISLKWENPTDVDELICFDVLYQEIMACHWKLLRTEKGSTTATIMGLKRNTTYIFKVRAVYSDDEGPYSDILREQTHSKIVPDFLENCVCLSNGNIALYKISTNAIHVNDQIRKYEVLGNFTDLKDQSRRTIILIGMAGPEKKMFIEGLVNHLLGVVVTDKERFTILEDNISDDETDLSITLYQMTQYCGEHINIIDCTILSGEKDNDRMELLLQFFEHIETPKQIDAVCVFAMSHLSVSITDLYSIFSVFGKDISNHVLIITSLLDKNIAPVFEKCLSEGVIVQKTLSFEFSATFSEYENDVDFYVLNYKWDANKKAYNSFLDSLLSFDPCILLQTIQTLQFRNRQHELQKTLLCKLRERDIAKKHLNETQAEINVYDSELSAGQTSLHTGTISFDKIIPNSQGEGDNNTNCYVCFTTCHESCAISDDEGKENCVVMKDGFCTECPKRCAWRKHYNKPFTIKKTTNIISTNNVQVFMDRWDVEKEKVNLRAIEFRSEITKCDNKISETLIEIGSNIIQLQICALYAGPVDTKNYIEQLVAKIINGTSEEACECVTLLKDLCETI